MYKSLFVIFLSFLLFTSCGRQAEQSNAGERSKNVVTVKVTLAELKEVTQSIKVTGDIAPLYSVHIYPKVPGIVISEEVKLGSRVRKNQTLAQMEQDVPGMEFSTINIEATTSGAITVDNVEIGGKVNVQQPVYTISGLERVYMVARLNESDLGKISTGQQTSVKVDAYPEKEFFGKITEIYPVVDRMSRTGTVKITLNNDRRLLKPGMFATGQIYIGTHNAMMIPWDAIVRVGANSYIYVIRNNKADQINIKTGIVEKDMVEVIGNVSAGDSVVALGQNLLEDEMPVSISEDF